MKKAEKTNKPKKWLWLAVVVCAVILVAAVFLFGRKESVLPARTEETEMTMPAINLGGKRPDNFTLEDYQNLSIEEQALFPDCFDSMEAFYTWYESVNPSETVETEPAEEVSKPVLDLSGKKPGEFTWEEYQQLSPDDQALFPDAFDTLEDYYAWYESVAPDDETVTDPVSEESVPTVDLGGKNPEDLTWEDYEALTPDEKMFLPDCFESFEEYEIWYDSVCTDN